MEKDCKCGGGEGFYNFYILYCNITVSGRAGGHHHAVTASPPSPLPPASRPNQTRQHQQSCGEEEESPGLQQSSDSQCDTAVQSDTVTHDSDEARPTTGVMENLPWSDSSHHHPNGNDIFQIPHHITTRNIVVKLPSVDFEKRNISF